ncbi:MAG: hypothetical protein JWM35_342, partial [Verrucomicrobia bacterium]|nr:hypothetical protein [Verrucomicrobiota bacterium]
ESDRALYRANTPLPPDWIARAQAAIAAKRVPGFSIFSALRGRNLAPFLLLVTLMLVLPSLRAQDAAVAYKRGDFAAAEKAWTAEVAHAPTNAVARHNLSLALAQQDRWDLALAHVTAALVQSPRSEPIRWQFALAGEKAGFLPAPLVAFPKPGPMQSLAQLSSPGGWQRWLIAASAIFAFSCGASLYGAYRRPSSLRSGVALAGFVVSVVIACSAFVAIRAYGQTADARAIIVWRGSVLRSIPTEADTTQKTTTLPAGSVAIVDKTFLTWVRLSFDNGQTGWVRKDDTVALWH